jgi:hypothetical protein
MSHPLKRRTFDLALIPSLTQHVQSPVGIKT